MSSLYVCLFPVFLFSPGAGGDLPRLAGDAGPSLVGNGAGVNSRCWGDEP